MKRYSIHESDKVEDENGEFIYFSDAEGLLAETTVLKSKLSDLEAVIDRLERTITTLSAKVVKAKEVLDGRQ